MKVRKTARVLLFNSDNQILLQYIIPLEPLKLGAEKVWTTPGGKIENNESIHECAERELCEETGIAGCELGPIVWHGSHVLRLNGEDTIFDESFVIATTQNSNIPKNGDDLTILGHKWWSLEELLMTKEVTFPWGLAILIKEIMIQKNILEQKEIKAISFY